MKKLVFAFALVTGLISCKKEFDSPPARDIPAGSTLTIADLRALYTGTSIRFSNNETVYATVTADEVSGNLYKNVYIQDNTGAINVRLMSSGGLYVGDSLRINLSGTVLSSYNGVLQIDSVDADNNIVKQATGKFVQPELVTLDMINSNYQSRLVQIPNVQFIAADTSATYADAINQSSQNRTIADCYGNIMIIRTSGYANFAGTNIPNGNGTITAIVGQFNTTMQLLVRNLNDVGLNGGTRCAEPYLDKDFEDLSISSGGWTQQLVLGGISWTADSFGADKFAKVTNYSGSNVACESWLISPPVNLSGATNPVLTFRTACNYTGSNIEVFVMTNYDGISSPSTATLTPLSPALSAGSWAWVNSGSLSLSSFLQNNVYIGFKYTGTSTNGKTWEVDDILIEEL